MEENNWTFASDREQTFQTSKDKLFWERDHYYRSIASVNPLIFLFLEKG